MASKIMFKLFIIVVLIHIVQSIRPMNLACDPENRFIWCIMKSLVLTGKLPKVKVPRKPVVTVTPKPIWVYKEQKTLSCEFPNTRINHIYHQLMDLHRLLVGDERLKISVAIGQIQHAQQYIHSVYKIPANDRKERIKLKSVAYCLLFLAIEKLEWLDLFMKSIEMDMAIHELKTMVDCLKDENFPY